MYSGRTEHHREGRVQRPEGEKAPCMGGHADKLLVETGNIARSKRQSQAGWLSVCRKLAPNIRYHFGRGITTKPRLLI